MYCLLCLSFSIIGAIQKKSSLCLIVSVLFGFIDVLNTFARREKTSIKFGEMTPPKNPPEKNSDLYSQ